MTEARFTGAEARAILAPYDGISYSGLSYEQSNRKGQALAAAAADSGCWKHLSSHLHALLKNMIA
jgi:hypothetical protein